MLPARNPVLSPHGMVATSQPCASRAGVAMLAAGGSALDAALAANAVLAVAEPHMCGPGGDLFALVWDPAARALAGLNASGRSPLGLDGTALRAVLGHRAGMPARGPLCVTVPGAVDGWCTLHARFGRLPLGEVLAPAIAAANEGVRIGPRTAAWWTRAAADIAADPDAAAGRPGFAATFLTADAAPAAGDRHRNPALAKSLERIAEGGRAGFYEGETGRALVACVAAAGGALAAADLAGPHAEWVAPLATRYRGVDVHALPPNGQGACVLQLLNLLEGFPLAELGRDSADWWHYFVEAKKLVFADRAHCYADPARARLPIPALIDKAYAAERRQLIRREQASRDPTPGHVAVPGSDTTYVATADRAGMMVSLIQSIFNPFGSALVPAGCGFALQSRGAGFSLDPRHANGYAAGKRPFHTIIPGFVLRAGEPWLALGVTGADMQPQGQVQVIVNLVDFGLDVEAAGAVPRVRHTGGTHPSGLVEDALGIVHHEPGLTGAVLAELARRGHRLAPADGSPVTQFGGYQGVARLADGSYAGASDPRFDGCALGV